VPDPSFARYLSSLGASWRALAAPDPDAVVTEEAGVLALRRPRHPVLNNAALLDAEAAARAVALFGGDGAFAVRSRDDAGDAALAAAGLRPDVTTWPMTCRLETLPDVPGDRDAVREVPPRLVAELNGVAADLLDDVPGSRTFATPDGAAAALLVVAGDDVNVSFVATRPSARRQGRATSLVAGALARARDDGARTASLQSTDAGRGLYGRLGFTVLGRWREWVPA
jgi:GNAT superfamily N-acetyltransferase